jgi:hypothetical protein
MPSTDLVSRFATHHGHSHEDDQRRRSNFVFMKNQPLQYIKNRFDKPPRRYSRPMNRTGPPIPDEWAHHPADLTAEQQIGRQPRTKPSAVRQFPAHSHNSGHKRATGKAGDADKKVSVSCNNPYSGELIWSRCWWRVPYENNATDSAPPESVRSPQSQTNQRERLPQGNIQTITAACNMLAVAQRRQ